MSLSDGLFTREERTVQFFLLILCVVDMITSGVILMGAVPRRFEPLVALAAGVGTMFGAFSAILIAVFIKKRWARWIALVLFGQALIVLAGLSALSLSSEFGGCGAAVSALLGGLWIIPLRVSWRLLQSPSRE